MEVRQRGDVVVVAVRALPISPKHLNEKAVPREVRGPHEARAVGPDNDVRGARLRDALARREGREVHNLYIKSNSFLRPLPISCRRSVAQT